MDFYKACAEVYFILEHLREEDRKHIPEGVIQFFKDNADQQYSVSITMEKPLESQVLLDETKAFLHILYIKYLM